jgi:hypothetical protein
MCFDRFGRGLGFMRLAKGHRDAVPLILHPLDSVRYKEFPFVLRHVPRRPGRCLDVSSPRLFSLYVASRQVVCPSGLTVINPDADDLQITRELARIVGASGACFRPDSVQEFLQARRDRFDTIWSISVVEHVAGACDDSGAMTLMWNALAPRGRLIVTVPVDRTYREEFSRHRAYPTQPRGPDGSFFFQRFYDADTLWHRLVKPLGVEPVCVTFFGERVRDWWATQRSYWASRRVVPHVVDCLDIDLGFREYGAFMEMPGVGVAGIVIDKPASPDRDA